MGVLIVVMDTLPLPVAAIVLISFVEDPVPVLNNTCILPFVFRTNVKIVCRAVQISLCRHPTTVAISVSMILWELLYIA